MNFFVAVRHVLLALLCFALAGCASKVSAPVVDQSHGVKGGSSVAVSDPAKSGVGRLPRKGYHIVKPGDTLFRIAADNGVSDRDLAVWNKLDDPRRIEVGQELRLTSPGDGEGSLVAVAKPVGVQSAVEQRPLEGGSDALKTTPKAGRDAYSDEALVRLERMGANAQAAFDASPDVKVEASVASSGIQWGWPAMGKVTGQFSETGRKGLDIVGKLGDAVQAASDGKVVYGGTGLRGFGQLLIIKHDSVFMTAYAHNSKLLVKEGQAVVRGQKIAEMGDTEADQVKLHFEVRRHGKPVDPLKYLPPR